MPAKASMSILELKVARKIAAHRRRRIIFNNDGDDIGRLGRDAPQEELAMAGNTRKYPLTKEGFLDVRTTALLGSHVDAIWYYSTWGMKLHYSDGSFGRLYSCPDPTVSTRNFKALLDRYGKDNLELMIDCAHENGLEIFYSNRMNDVHDSFSPTTLYHMRQEHPEWCLSKRTEGEKFQYPDARACWTAWNFETPEIRLLIVEAMREICEVYDIDGIELDFWRHPLCFPETMRYKPVTPKNISLMNDMMRDIRKVVDEVAMKRGRPILIAGRCLEDIELSRNSGLDVQTWLKEGLVDIITVAYSTEHTPPIKILIDLAHRYDVPIYPIMSTFHKTEWDDTGNKINEMFGNLPVWRADALNIFAQGADGVQMFNIFDPTLPQWKELGDPEMLRTLDRTYVWDFRPSQREGRGTFSQMRVTRFKKPVVVTAHGCEEPIVLYVGEDLSTPDVANRVRKLILRIRLTGLTVGHKLQICANGKNIDSPMFSPVPDKTPKDIWGFFPVEAKLLNEGDNIVTAKLIGGTGKPVMIDEVRLDVRHID